VARGVDKLLETDAETLFASEDLADFEVTNDGASWVVNNDRVFKRVTACIPHRHDPPMRWIDRGEYGVVHEQSLPHDAWRAVWFAPDETRVSPNITRIAHDYA
jgi:hypothetical protein